MAKRKGSTGIQVALRYKRFSELRKQGLKVEDIGKMAGYDHSTVSYGLNMYNQNQSMYDKIIEANNWCLDLNIINYGRYSNKTKNSH